MVLVRLRAFLGVLDWPVPPSVSMPQDNPHAYLGEVKQCHEEYYLNTAEEKTIDRDLVQTHSEEACNSINLGRFSKQVMPEEVIEKITEQLHEPVCPRYRNLDGQAMSYFLRSESNIRSGRPALRREKVRCLEGANMSCIWGDQPPKCVVARILEGDKGPSCTSSLCILFNACLSDHRTCHGQIHSLFCRVGSPQSKYNYGERKPPDEDGPNTPSVCRPA
jgi:hypothetical protein